MASSRPRPGPEQYLRTPSRPWQRGSNEYTNVLLRQNRAKGADLRDLTQPSATTSPSASTRDPI